MVLMLLFYYELMVLDAQMKSWCVCTMYTRAKGVTTLGYANGVRSAYNVSILTYPCRVIKLLSGVYV